MSRSPHGRSPRGRAAAGAAVLLGTLAAQAAAVALAGGADAAPVADAAPAAASPTGHFALRKPELNSTAQALTGSTGYVLGPLQHLRLDPWANSSADPLNNGVALVPDSPGSAPVSTQPLTAPLSSGGGLSSVPLAGPVVGSLGG